MGNTSTYSLKTTPLHALHVELGARMVPFAGYDMPVQYVGIIAEHTAVRESAGLFDVSHMGQGRVTGPQRAEALERLVPGNILGLKEGRQRYTMLTNDEGGILDDLMVTNTTGEELFLIVNAACKEQDFAYIGTNLGEGAVLEQLPDRALLALQGSKAAEVMARLAPASAKMTFMTWARLEVAGVSCGVTRSGYTGEDGFEISVPGNRARALAERLLALSEVGPAGLGARDSLRLEAGLCLHGHDIDRSTDPAEAGLAWIIPKLRRTDGGFLGDRAVQAALAAGPKRCRIGLRLEGRRPVRAGSQILDRYSVPIGSITSGGYSPTLAAPVAMGYVGAEHAEPGSALHLDVRGTAIAAAVVPLPFVPHRRHHRP